MNNPSVITARDADGNLYPGACGYSPTIACRYTDLPECPDKCQFSWWPRNCMKLYPSADDAGQMTFARYAC